MSNGTAVWLRSKLFVYIAAFAAFGALQPTLWNLPLGTKIAAWIAIAAFVMCLGLRPKRFQIDFRPHVWKMLIELGVMTEAEWLGERDKPADPDAKSGDSLARNGLTAVAFTSPVWPLFTVHWPSMQAYTYEFAFEIKLECIRMDEPLRPGGSIRPAATCFMSPGKEGYEFGIVLRQDMWKLHRERLEASGLVKKISDSGEAYLVLEILPYQVLWPYRPIFVFRLGRIRHHILPRFGWTVENHQYSEIYKSPFVQVTIGPLSDKISTA